eukprot:scpid92566/ scgid30125/ 
MGKDKQNLGQLSELAKSQFAAVARLWYLAQCMPERVQEATFRCIESRKQLIRGGTEVEKLGHHFISESTTRKKFLSACVPSSSSELLSSRSRAGVPMPSSSSESWTDWLVYWTFVRSDAADRTSGLTKLARKLLSNVWTSVCIEMPC